MADTTDLPTPVKRSSRVCFGVAYFATEAEAERYAAHVRERGDTYNGGFYDGTRCGRDSHLDHEHEGRRVFAVTTR